MSKITNTLDSNIYTVLNLDTQIITNSFIFPTLHSIKFSVYIIISDL